MPKLKRPTNVVLKADDAHAIISWLYGSTSVSPKQFTKEDCGFAQALLVDMLDSSFAMGFVEALLRSAVKLPGGPKKVIVAFLKGAGKNLVKYKDKGDYEKMLKDPVIYKSVKDQATRMTRSVWKIREQTEQLTY